MSSMPCGHLTPFLAFCLTFNAFFALPSPNENNVQKAASKSTFLWSIDSPSRKVRSFLFGTIHVPYDRVWQFVSPRVKEAFGAAEAIVFELELQNAETVLRLAKCKQLERDGHIGKLLPADVYERLRAFMRRLRQRMFRRNLQRNGNDRQKARQNVRRAFPNDWDRRKPMWLLFLLLQTAADEQQQQWAPRGQNDAAAQNVPPMFDLYLAQMAQEQGKQLFSVESVAEQCHPLESVKIGQLFFAINYTLAYLEFAERAQNAGGEGTEMKQQNGNNSSSNSSRTPSALEQLVEVYNCGTMGEQMEQIVFGARRFAQRGFSSSPEADQMARHVDNLLAEDILLRRNERMARRADLLLRSHPSAVLFFALGAGHLLGDRSILSHLRQFGYWLAPIGEKDKIIAADPWGSAALPSGDEIVQFLDFSIKNSKKLMGRHSEMPRRRIALQIGELRTEGKASGAKRAARTAKGPQLHQLLIGPFLLLLFVFRPFLPPIYC